MKEDPDFQRKQRERILTAAKNMQATTEVLLSIVKQENIQTGHQPRIIEQRDINLDKYRAKLNQNVEISLSVEPDTRINLPSAVLDMILQNLINNAIRFTEHGTITVILNHRSIKVIDTGCGLKRNTETEHGLGLLIVRRLCKSYGWVFSLKENPNGGCCAELTFTTHTQLNYPTPETHGATDQTSA